MGQHDLITAEHEYDAAVYVYAKGIIIFERDFPVFTIDFVQSKKYECKKRIALLHIRPFKIQKVCHSLIHSSFRSLFGWLILTIVLDVRCPLNPLFVHCLLFNCDTFNLIQRVSIFIHLFHSLRRLFQIKFV